MVGAICKTEVLFHPLVTIQCFGWTVFFRAVFAGKEQTFLSLLNHAGTFQRTPVPMHEFIGRCITLERRAMRIYESLAVRFAEPEPVAEFFLNLARQEEIHAELLELCRAARGRGRWQAQTIEMWRQGVPATERRLRDAEAALGDSPALTDVLRLVIRMESSQINGLFTSIVKATDDRFGKVFSAFRSTVRQHLEYIRKQVLALEPSLERECELLQIS